MELQLARGINEKKVTRPSLSEAGGPGAIMHLEFARNGWSMDNFDILENRSGFEGKLTDFSPRQMMAADHYAQMLKEIGQHVYVGENPTMEPIKLTANSKKVSPLEKGLIRTLATGALWTCSRSRSAGYDGSPSSCLCGQAEDTLMEVSCSAMKPAQQPVAIRHCGAQGPAPRKPNNWRQRGRAMHC